MKYIITFFGLFIIQSSCKKVETIELNKSTTETGNQLIQIKPNGWDAGFSSTGDNITGIGEGDPFIIGDNMAIGFTKTEFTIDKHKK